MIVECNKTKVVNTIVSNSIYIGMLLIFTQNINIINITLSHNGAGLNVSNKNILSEYVGKYICGGYNIVLNSIISMYNGRGIVIVECNKTQVVNTIVFK